MQYTMKTVPSIAAAIAATLLLPATITFAQDNPPAGGRRGGGNFEEFRQRMNERLKTSLKATDEEWSVLQPLIEKVQAKQRETISGRFGGFGGFGGRGGPGGGGGDRTAGGGGGGGGNDRGGNRGGSAESQALRDAVEKDGTAPEEIKAKLAAVRDQRKKAQSELDAAREELRKVLTVRQEAVLVTFGILE
jgi:Spy/CpxP family protein refolding chaperone